MNITSLPRVLLVLFGLVVSHHAYAQTPGLSIVAGTNQSFALSWPATASGYVLESVEELSGTSAWRSAPEQLTVVNDEFKVVFIATNSARFFRLRSVNTGGLPPDPATVAPPVSKSTATDLGTATSFLYTGPNPIQTGVTNGTIELRRAAVLRGKVMSRDGAALSGMRITVLGHPEFGQTLSRADGAFDLAVNGGGQLTVRYEKEGFLAAQRAIAAPWRDYAWLPDVVMIPFDAAVTTVDLSVAAMQVARGSAVSDADGTRQATILFPQGTTAGLIMPNGTTQTVSSLNIRATEFTVGTNGPAAMPAPLPPSSGYTYCVELSADEAVAAGAADVRFTQPLPVYVENFLGFPVGTAVPTGYYDRQKGQWIASANGRVIKVISITGGLADLDTDGDNFSDDAAKLAALGVTSEERARLAELYTPGQTLWRVPITHFTPWDLNWPYGPPADAIPPVEPRKPDPPIDYPNEECGSVISVENQTLGESVPVTGIPWRLHYTSGRTPGRRDKYVLEVPVIAQNVPASLRGIRVQVSIVGRLYQAAFAPAPNLNYVVTWDGRDGYGRVLHGTQKATVQVHYDYVPQLYVVRNDFERSFGRAAAAGFAFAGTRGASTLSLSKTWTAELGGIWDARAIGLGGWTPTIQHSYNAGSRTLLLGDGRQRFAETVGTIISTVAGNGEIGFNGNGGPALASRLAPTDVAVSPDGSVYISDYNSRIRKVGTDGIITTAAGTGLEGSSGDGGPATAARIGPAAGIAVGPDGTLYIADPDYHRIRRVDTAGMITTLAGTGVRGFSGDEGPATAAQLSSPRGVAVGPDGSVFIAEPINNRIRRVGPDGIITTVAGSGVEGFSGDGGQATAAKLYYPRRVAVGSDGSLYIADDGNFRVRRVAPDGIIATLAGTGTYGYSGDGGPANVAGLTDVLGVAVGPDGSVYIADSQPTVGSMDNRIRRIGPNGIITTIAGRGPYGFSGDGGPATAARLYTPIGVAVAPDGSIYIADQENQRVRQVRAALPDFSISDILLSSEDGSEVYFFNDSRHLKTVDALTGALRYRFAYGADGSLISITDGSTNVTTIERSGAVPTAIIAPGGQRTALTVSSDGWLLGVTNSVGEAHTMNYSADGLLQQFINPLGNTNSFTYDPLGRLIKDEDPLGGSTTLSRTEQSNDYTVTSTSALGRSRIYQVEQLPTGAIRRTVTQASGAKTVTLLNTDGSEQTTNSDGSVITIQYGPDPRWGMLAPVASSVTLKTPGGLTRTVTTTRTATLADPSNLLSLTNLTDTITDNGAVSSSAYDATSRLFTITTAAGRSGSLRVDELGRLTQQRIAALAPVDYAYDSRGFLSTITESDSATSRTTSLTNNGAGDLSEISNALGRTMNFTYDLVGRLVIQRLPDGRPIQYTYDAAGNAMAITPPGRPTHRFTYTPIGLMSSYTPPDLGNGSITTRYSYNADSALTRTTRPDGQTVDFGYDNGAGCNCDRLSTLTLPTGVFNYAYDPTTGKLTGVNAPGGIGLSYSYDGSLLTGVTWTGPVSGAIAYTYNNDFRVTNETVNGTSSVSFAYDADGLLTSAGSLALIRDAQNGLPSSTALGGITDSSSYNNLADLTNYSVAYSGSGIYSASYLRDAIGRITQTTETLGGITTTYGYVYDAAGRLSGVIDNGTTVRTYAYDSNGNRTGVTTSAGTVNAAYDDQDRLMTFGGATYSHTTNGEWLSKTMDPQTTTYQYDALGNLTAATLPDGQGIEYLIDGRNRRVGKKVNGVLVQAFLYRGRLRPVAEMNGTSNIVSRFIYASRGNVPDYMIKGGATCRIITDHIGSPRLVVNVETGSVAQRMDYDEFGRVLNDTNPGFQPFGFAGGVYDRDTRLVRFGARDYDPETGRWTAKDPILFGGGDPNLYVYGLNDPVNNVDSQGTEPDKRGYDTELDARMAAVADAYLSTARTGWEYGGEIYKKDNKYHYNIRTDKNAGSVSVGRANCPAGSDPLALFHSHPGDFKNFHPEVFSPEDKEIAFSEGLDNYVITPLGALLQRSNGKTKDLGRFTF